MSIAGARRRGGARSGGFPGADIILGQLDRGAARRRVGLRPQGRAPVRGGAALFGREDDTVPVGTVTSGGFAVSLGAPIAMGYVPLAQAAPTSRLFTMLRGRREALQVCPLPFVPLRYKRA